MKNSSELQDLRELCQKYKVENLRKYLQLYDNETLLEESEDQPTDVSKGGFVENFPQTDEDNEVCQ